MAVETDVMIPMRDGVRLAADVYRPARDGKPVEGRFPTLLTRTPYDKGDGSSAEGKYYAARGYVVVMNDVRGRYASEGTWRLMADDPDDGYDVVEWIAAQPWSDGKVGTFGTSYPGGTQHALAEMNPPAPDDDGARSTRCRTAGSPACGTAGRSSCGSSTGSSTRAPPTARPPWPTRPCKAALDENGRRIREHVDHLPVPPRDHAAAGRPRVRSRGWSRPCGAAPRRRSGTIKGMSVVDHVADYADVPVLHVTGWYDSWTRQVTMNYEALSKAKRSPQRLVDRPLGPRRAGLERRRRGRVHATTPRIDLLAFRLRWYDRWLQGASATAWTTTRRCCST